MKFLTINGKIQTLGGNPITVPDSYNNDLIKIDGMLVNTGTGLIGSKHSGSSSGGAPSASCLTFSSPTSFSMAVHTPRWNGTMEYSTDKVTWITWDGSVINSSASNVIYLRGIGNTYITGMETINSEDPSFSALAISGTNIKCEGNIENILDYTVVESGQHPTMDMCCFAALFWQCSSLTEAPQLPMTTLSVGCYYGMFAYCTNLTTIPILPATTLTESCYLGMFIGCSNLKFSKTKTGEYSQPYRIPEGGTGATASGALDMMFEGTGGSFTGTPNINTTYYLSASNSIIGVCDHHWNAGEVTKRPCVNPGIKTYTCSICGKTKTEDIPAIASSHTWDAGVITQAPTVLPGSKTFTCTICGEKETVEIPAVAPKYLAFASPKDFSIYVQSPGWNGTMEYSTDEATWETWDGSKISAKGGTAIYLRGSGNKVITGTTSDKEWTLTGTDVRCIGNIENLLDYSKVQNGNPNDQPTMGNDCYRYMFYNCTSLTEAPTLPAKTLTYCCYAYMFYGCTNLTTAPALPATTLAIDCYRNMFSSCNKLTTAPALPATTLADYCYYSMFSRCTSLTVAPALPATTLATNCYSYMFSSCTSLTTVPTLPATTLAIGCYESMFSSCNKLTTAPALPATTLADYCYRSMFSNCSAIKLSEDEAGEYTKAYRIPTSETGTTATDALTDMFKNTGGTFKGTPTINKTYYLHSSNSIVG